MEQAEIVRRREVPRAQAYLSAAALVLVAIAVGTVLRRLPHANLSLLFLLAVLIVAAAWGFWPSILSTVLSFLAINFFFTAPLYSFTVEEEGDLASMVFFLAMAALTANLAARMRNEMAENQAALERVSTLLDFSSRMSSAVAVEDALAALSRAIGRGLQREVAIWLPGEDGQLQLTARTDDALHALDLDVPPGAPTSNDGDEPGAESEVVAEAGSTPDRPGVSLLELELEGSGDGVIAVSSGPLSPEERKFADGLCEQAVLAVERILLEDNLRAAQLAAQTEQLRAALLSSVSHDLRTPLASIIGSVSTILEYRDRLSPDDQRDLLGTVLEESQRLNRYIQNLLDMTRFGRKQIELSREWVDLNDLVSSACERLGRALDPFEIRVDIAPRVALICVQGALIEQALVNILDNAIDFSESGDEILIRAYLEDSDAVIDVLDRGPGIPEADREKVFEMFYMGPQPDDRRHGVGLGLAICRSIVEAHGGTVDALPGQDGRGTCMRICLPIAENSIESTNA
jgi:two-component system sensor histidine kinase KdpD